MSKKCESCNSKECWTNTGQCNLWVCMQCDQVISGKEFHQNTLMCLDCRYSEDDDE